MIKEIVFGREVVEWTFQSRYQVGVRPKDLELRAKDWILSLCMAFKAIIMNKVT